MATLIIGATSILRTLSVVAIGAFSATLLENVASTNSWFSIINVYIFLPCLLFGHFSTSFSTQVFFEGLPLVIFGFSRILIGSATTKLATMFGLFDDETQPLALLATSSSNAIAIPLAILGELVTRVDFLSNGDDYDVLDVASGKMVTAKQYLEILLFVFAIPTNFSIWSFGQFFIRTAVAKRHEKEKLQQQQQQQQQLEEDQQQEHEQQQERNQTIPLSVSVGNDLSSSPENQVAAHDESNQNSLPPPASPQNYLSPLSSVGANKKAEQDHQHESTLKYVFRVYIIRSLSVPLIASLGGIAISLIPHVQDGITGAWPFMASLSNVVVLLGSAAVPSALITVGITVYRTLTAPKKEQTPNSSSTIGDKLTKFFGIQASLVITTSAVQLIITPLVVYLLMTQLIYKSDFAFIAEHSSSNFENLSNDPEMLMYWKKRRLMFFALLVEACCPSAMNTVIICTLYKYRSEDFSRMIVYQYILSVFTMSLFVSLALSSLQ